MKINVKGPIINDADQWIYDWFGIPATSPSKVINALDEAERTNDKNIIVSINSGGGSVFAASEIYAALKGFDGNVTSQIVSMAASAATVIALGAQIVEMATTGQFMIHNASSTAQGDYRDMHDTGNFLEKVNQSIMNAYTAKTGKTADELKIMMDNTTWMTAQEALEHGFIDKIMFEKEVGATASSEHPELVNGVLPPEVIEKVRNTLMADKSLQVVNQIDQPKQQKEGGTTEMNLETLKNDHPDLFEQVKNIGIEEGTEVENARIQAIEDIAMPGNEALVTAAKFSEPITAEQLAMNMIKAEKAKGANFAQSLKDDALPLNDIAGSHTPDPTMTEAEKEATELKNIWEGI